MQNIFENCKTKKYDYSPKKKKYGSKTHNEISSKNNSTTAEAIKNK